MAIEIFKFIFSVFGAVLLLQIALVGTPVRYKKPFSCAACLGFWIGLFACDALVCSVWWSTGAIGARVTWATVSAGTSWILSGIIPKERS